MAAPILPEEIYKAFFFCHLCDNVYKEPRLLPCGHSFCFDCLQDYIHKLSPRRNMVCFLCPTCREITKVTKRGVKGYPVNEFVEGLKGTFQYHSANVHCHLSEKTTEDDSGVGSIVGSVDCLNVVSSPSVSQTHDASPFAFKLCTDVQDHRLNQTSEEKEKQHASCKVGCLTNCNKGTSAAKVPSHFGKAEFSEACHTISASSISQGKNSSSTLESARKEVHNLKHGLSKLNSYRRSIEKCRNDATKTIESQADHLRKIVSAIEKKMVSDIRLASYGEINRVDLQMDHYKSSLKTLENLSSFMEVLMHQDQDQLVEETLKVFLEGIVKNTNHSEERHLLQRPLKMNIMEPEHDITEIVTKAFGNLQMGRELFPAFQSKQIEHKNQCINNYITREPSSKISAADLGLIQGELLNTLSLNGAGIQQQTFLTSLCPLTNGDLVVVDQANRCVKFIREGAVYKKIYGSDSIFGVTELPDGNIAVTDHTLHIFDSEGRLLKVLRDQPRDSRGVAATKDNCVVVVDGTSRCVYVLGLAGGTVQKIITQRAGQPFRSPEYVSIGPQNETVVSDVNGKCVTVFNSSYELTGVFGTDQSLLVDPAGVCIDHMGTILVCDTVQNCVLAIDTNGRYICDIIRGNEYVSFPVAIATDKCGRMYISEKGGNIKVFTYRSIVQ